MPEVQPRSSAVLMSRQAIRDKVPCTDCGAASGSPCHSPGGYTREANHMARLKLAGIDTSKIQQSNGKLRAQKRQRARARREAQTPGGW